MTISDQIRMLCARLNISKAELARRIGQSPQNLNSKLRRGSFTIEELDRIGSATGSQFIRLFKLYNGEEIGVSQWQNTD
jgi:transcriptional regulator with XRE-family HTH domain